MMPHGSSFIVNGATPAKNSALPSAGAGLRFASPTASRYSPNSIASFAAPTPPPMRYRHNPLRVIMVAVDGLTDSRVLPGAKNGAGGNRAWDRQRRAYSISLDSLTP
jgi:hypothetical protein